MKTISPLYNFITVALFLLTIRSFFNPCDVPYYQRKDCGFSGISVPTCQTFGKLRLMFLSPIVFIQMAVWSTVLVGGSVYAWSQTKLPQATLAMYVCLAVMTLHAVTGCCYDGINVPEGLPHCFH